jgi:choline dehydrogenase
MSQATPPSTFPEAFDYIVVGAGSSGAVVAARLSEDPEVRVLLLEAGGPDKNKAVHIPAAFSTLFKSDVDWNYQTVPQGQLGGRTVYWPRGKMLGGSSSLNAMMWVRGFDADYDRWAQLAGPQWSASALRPYLAASQVPVDDQRDPRRHTARFLDAVREVGYHVEEANREAPDGFSRTRVTQQRGARASTAVAYLRPAASRRNLVIRTHAHVTRVLFEGRRATGVEYMQERTVRAVGARSEVILAGGAVNTPQLLMLSGIGDPQQLSRLGIEVVAASPEVGRNLRDHLASLIAVAAPGDTLHSAATLPQLARYLLARKGMLTSNVAEAYGFVRSDPALTEPDIEILYAPVAYVYEGLVPSPGHGLSIGPVLLQPRSRGAITLASSDPLDKAVVDPNYLSDRDGADRAVLLRGLAICRRILSASALRPSLTGKVIAPEGFTSLDDAALDEASLRILSHTLYHPTSTARMGLDDASVVDPALRVRGVDGLRVADASVMPEIIRGHTHAPCVVIGEKAADLVRTASRSRLHAHPGDYRSEDASNR